jgi:outer membrane protein assembly factor BamD (BamD/ComL family)
LRSLRIRAEKVGAVIEPLPYDDKELAQRLDQLYTEGLAAFWVEDWDKACHRFQTILSERPNHAGAAEKLEEAERQRNFAKLYSKAVEAQKNQEWRLVINTLEDLLKKASTYKDADAILKTARREQQLKVLYTESKTLYTAQKWEAVIKVFEQISSIEANYADPEGLLASAQREVAELQRLSRLNELYSNAIHKMDAGQWYEARTLLEQVHKSEIGFLETERLLRKVEDEIKRLEDEQKRQDQINTFYEQAHGMLRSKKWRQALEKIEAIYKLDEQFDDPEKIAEQAQKELEREEQEAKLQNELAAMYAEAAKLNQSGKYQQALEQWNQIRTLDASYPDRQRVRTTAQKMLKKMAQAEGMSEKLAWKQRLHPGWGILTLGVLWYVIRLGALSIVSLFGITNSAINELIRWSLFGITTGLLNLLVFHFFKITVSNKQKIILVGGWFAGSLVTPMMVWLFPELTFRFYIGHTLTGACYGLVLHYTLPDFLYRPKLPMLMFAFAFGMFAGDCSFTWFRDSAGIAAPHYAALTLGVAGLVSASLAFGRTIAAYAEGKFILTIEKTALSVAGILIAARWLSSVIGEFIAGRILEPSGINWDSSPYLLINLYNDLFAVFSAWFIIRLLKNKLLLPVTKKEVILLVASWIVGMTAASFTCVYLGIDLQNEWGWRIGWGVGGINHRTWYVAGNKEILNSIKITLSHHQYFELGKWFFPG